MWFISPFRTESTASFKINEQKNVWFDFGLGKGGNIIDFVAILRNISNISEILKYIEANHKDGVFQKVVKSFDRIIPFSFHQQKPLLKPEIHISELKSDVLKKYLMERGISEHFYHFVYQANTFKSDKVYVALAFRNDKGGYELRNRYYKGCTSKAVTHLFKDYHSPVFVTEGFFDYLSLWELANRQGNDSINVLKQSNFLVLNSVSLQ